MSRHPSTQVQINNISDIAEECVNNVAENAVPKALTLSKISEESPCGASKGNQSHRFKERYFSK